MIRSVLASALAVVMSVGAASAATVTVFEDKFEYGEAIPVPGSTLGGWTISEGSIDLLGPGSYASWCGAGQGSCLDMNGSTSTAGKIEQLITGLISGQTYELTFDYGNNQNSKSATVAEVLEFGIDGLLGSVSVFAVSTMQSSMIYSFVATGTSATLFFRDAGTTPGDNGGPLLDNVRLSTVPLPAGGLLLLGGLAGLAALRRRKAA
jgi:hypothetical protein